MDESKLNHLSYMWTTEKDNWWLVKVENADRYLVFFHSRATHGFLYIDNEELEYAIINKMLQAGNKLATSEEYSKFIDSIRNGQ